ncbi:MAG: M23 family metallopeptidase [Bacteroidales bacterium]
MFEKFVNNHGFKILLICIGLYSSAFNCFAQHTDYHFPMKIPMVISGSFCESRSGHFHTGIDIKTLGVTGQKLYAIDDAVLYRIKVSAYGYGKALYLLHPDSTLSVYAHMKRFLPDVEAAVKRMQYHKKSFELDTILHDSLFVYKKGECIGYSGNSGASEAPHLHFEMRKMPSEKCFNPQQFWYFRDDIQPLFKGIVFYDLDANYKTEAQRSDYYYAGNVRNNQITLDPGQWGIGADILDRMNGTHNRYGIIELILEVDEATVYHSRIDDFNWSNQKYTTTWFDVYYLETRRSHVQRCFREPGNKTDLIIHSQNDGVVHLEPGDEKSIVLKARDAAGNWSEFRFALKATGNKKPTPVSKSVYAAGKAVNFPFEGGYLSVPEGALYRPASIRVNTRLDSEGHYTGWSFSDPYYVFLEPLGIFLDGSAVKSQNRKYTVVMCKRDGKEQCLTGEWHGPYFGIHTKKPGDFYFATDSLPPRLYGSRMRDSVRLQGYNEISYRVSDNLSGLAHFNAWIDGNWVLLQYERKYNKLFYRFDEHTEKGKWHNWKIRVEDAVGNVREEKAVFYY